MSRRLLSWIVIAAVATPAGSLFAQTHFAVSAGYSGAGGDFGNAVSSGYQVGASLELSVPASPLSVRFDGAFDQFKYKLTRLVGDANARVLSATANARLAPAQFGGVYLIGGYGLYRMSAECDGCVTLTTKGGVNGGVGYDLHLTGFTVFTEARYHYIPGPSDPTNAGLKGSSTQFFPITVGLRF